MLSNAYPNDTMLFSVAAVYPDGRMIEQTMIAKSLHEAKQTVRAFAVGATDVDGEYIMTLGEYLGK